MKYWIDRTTRTALTRDLLAFMRPDAHSDQAGGYLVRSLYYDTPDFMAFQGKVAGMMTRHKLRVRAYGENPNETPIVRLEVKSRYLSYIHKITVDIHRADYDELIATSHLDLQGPLRGGRRLQQFGRAIFEIKVDGVMPYWLHQLIAKYNLQSEAISKYCFAMRSEAKFSAVGRPEKYI